MWLGWMGLRVGGEGAFNEQLAGCIEAGRLGTSIQSISSRYFQCRLPLFWNCNAVPLFTQAMHPTSLTVSAEKLCGVDQGSAAKVVLSIGELYRSGIVSRAPC